MRSLVVSITFWSRSLVPNTDVMSEVTVLRDGVCVERVNLAEQAGERERERERVRERKEREARERVCV